MYRVNYGYYPWDNEWEFENFSEALAKYLDLVPIKWRRERVLFLINADESFEGSTGLTEEEEEILEVAESNIHAQFAAAKAARVEHQPWTVQLGRHVYKVSASDRILGTDGVTNVLD